VWPRYAVPNLKPSTQRRYLEVWGTHLLPALGDYELRAITPMLVEDLRAQFDAHRVGVQTQRKALMMLQGILRRAVVRGVIPANPVSVVDKPRQPPTRRPDPLPPIMVELIRAQLSQRDAALVSLLAYAGLRPDEATKARWGDLRDRTIYVHASKTERARMIKLLQPLAQDLAEWRMASGRPPDTALIFPTTTATNGSFTTGRTGAGASTSPRPRKRESRVTSASTGSAARSSHSCYGRAAA
jgi:integrase